MKKELIIFLSIILLYGVLAESCGVESFCFYASNDKIINKCTDSDDGIDIYTRGRLELFYSNGTEYISNNLNEIALSRGIEIYQDDCINEAELWEFKCDSRDIEDSYNCPNGCKDGACIKSTEEETCTDTDSGKNFEIEGVARSFLNGNITPNYFKRDICKEGTKILIESYCENNEVKEVEYICPNGCYDGACTNKTVSSCTDTDSGKNYSMKGFLQRFEYEVLMESATDVCKDSKILIENYCSSDNRGIREEYICPVGCKDGVCVNTISNNPCTPKCVCSSNGRVTFSTCILSNCSSQVTYCSDVCIDVPIGKCQEEVENESDCVTDDDCPQPNCVAESNCIGLINKCINEKCSIQKINEIKNETFRKGTCPANTTEEIGSCMKLLSNGKKVEIKIMPETASEKAIERLGELGFSVILKEIGKGNEIKSIYEVSGEKEGNFLGLFKTKGKVKVFVDTETGEIIKIEKPWWSFLATKI